MRLVVCLAALCGVLANEQCCTRTLPDLTGPCVTYSDEVITYGRDVAITANTPTYSNCTQFDTWDGTRSLNPPTSFQLTSNSDPLPVGLSLDPATGAITGTPTVYTNLSAVIVQPFAGGVAGPTVLITVLVGPNPAPSGIAFADTNPREDVYEGVVTIDPAVDEADFTLYLSGLSPTESAFGLWRFAEQPKRGGPISFAIPVSCSIRIRTLATGAFRCPTAFEFPAAGEVFWSSTDLFVFNFVTATTAVRVGTETVAGPNFASLPVVDLSTPGCTADSVSFVDTDPDTGEVGGVIAVAAPAGCAVAAYHLMFATVSCTGPGSTGTCEASLQTVATSVAVVGGTARFTVPDDTPFGSATQVYAYAEDATAVASREASTPLIDFAPGGVTLSSPAVASPGGASPLAVIPIVATFEVAQAALDPSVFTLVASPGLPVATNLTGNGTVWTYTVSVEWGPGDVITNGSLSVAMADTPEFGAPADAFVVVYDPPTVNISSSAGPSGSVASASTLPFLLWFSHSVAPLSPGDVTVSAGRLSTSVFVDEVPATGGTQHLVTVTVLTPGAVGAVTVALPQAVTTPPNAAAAGNFTLVHDADPPTLSSPAITPAPPAFLSTGSTFTVAYTSTEALASASVVLFLGTSAERTAAATLSDSDTVATVTYTVLSTDPQGEVALQFLGEDTSANAVQQTDFSTGLTVDSTRPSILTFSADETGSVLPSTPVNFTVTTSEVMQSASVVLFPSTASATTIVGVLFNGGLAASFTGAVPASAPRGALPASVTVVDLAGNTADSTLADTGLSVGASVAVSTSGVATSHNNMPFSVTVTVSVAAPGFTCSLITLTGAGTVTALPASVSGDNTVFTCAVQPSAPATLSLLVPAGATAGGFSLASNVLVLPYAVLFTSVGLPSPIAATGSVVELGPSPVDASFADVEFLEFTWTLLSSSSTPAPVITTPSPAFSSPSLVGVVQGTTHRVQVNVTDTRVVPPTALSAGSFEADVAFPAFLQGPDLAGVVPPLVIPSPFLAPNVCIIGRSCSFSFTVGGFLGSASVLAAVSAINTVTGGTTSTSVAFVPATAGSFSWTVSTATVPGLYAVTVDATDGLVSTTASEPEVAFISTTTPFVLVTSAFGTCSEPCGLGTQTRTVACVNVLVGAVVDTSLCADSVLPAPAVVQSCFTAACDTPEWFTSASSTCSEPCGGGTVTHDVVCVASTGVVDDSNCVAGDKPPTSSDCNTEACPPGFSVVSYSTTCSNPCGAGTSSVVNVCVSDQGAIGSLTAHCGFTGAAVTTTACDTSGECASSPNGVLLVEGQPGACLAAGTNIPVTCGGGEATRTDTCLDTSTLGLAPIASCGRTSATITVECNAWLCPTDLPPVWEIADGRDCVAPETCSRSAEAFTTVALDVSCLQPLTLAASSSCATVAGFTPLNDSCAVNGTHPVFASTCTAEELAAPIACPNDCSGRGTCVDGTCACDDGFSGTYCATAESCSGIVYGEGNECCEGVLTAGSATNQTCCAGASATLDRYGACCASGVVDACGVCDGSGAVTSTGACCQPPSVLDANGRCCASLVDVCGVCGGTGSTCGTLVDATLDIGAVDCASVSNPFTAAGTSFASSVAAAVEAALNRTATVTTVDCTTSVPVCTLSLPPVAATGEGFAVAAGAVLTGVTIGGGVPGSIVLVSTPVPAGVCGNDVCEAGERCVVGSTQPCCALDCPYRAVACPAPASSAAACSGRGTCLIGTTASADCDCFTGYSGLACDECEDGFFDAGNGVCQALPKAFPVPSGSDDRLHDWAIAAIVMLACLCLFCLICIPCVYCRDKKDAGKGDAGKAGAAGAAGKAGATGGAAGATGGAAGATGGADASASAEAAATSSAAASSAADSVEAGAIMDQGARAGTLSLSHAESSVHTTHASWDQSAGATGGRTTFVQHSVANGSMADQDSPLQRLVGEAKADDGELGTPAHHRQDFSSFTEFQQGLRTEEVTLDVSSALSPAPHHAPSSSMRSRPQVVGSPPRRLPLPPSPASAAKPGAFATHHHMDRTTVTTHHTTHTASLVSPRFAGNGAPPVEYVDDDSVFSDTGADLDRTFGMR